jgi:signal transduction histidine kinase
VTPPPAERLHRHRDTRLAAGVAAGIAIHLGIPVAAVRVAFVLLLAFNGLGALLYAVFWAALPVDPADGAEPRGRVVRLLPFAALAMGVLVARAVVGGDQPATAALGWLFALIAVGAGIIWHQTGGPGSGRVTAGWSQDAAATGSPWWGAILTENGRRGYLLRFVGGGVLIAIGAVGLAAVYAPVGGGGIAAIVNGLLFALLALAGVGLVTAPLLWRMFGALRQEREGRIREQERAEFAALVHDQVLHTLTLIQRSAPTGTEAHRLARSQERTLRQWLYRPVGAPTESVAAALEQAAAEVEDAYAITVEVVVVGAEPGTPAPERIEPLVAAAREALVNAARHAGVTTVSLYAEVEPHQVSVFVRDRGTGFDPAAVDPGRHGVRGSIIGRMQRYGGTAEIVSAPGEGTEVRLALPLVGEGKERVA